ncbi:MAG: LysM peptidoglycan-binding domain-containing protein [Chloroflexota bacterium]
MKISKAIRFMTLLATAFSLLALLPDSAQAQMKRRAPARQAQRAQRFPDEYSELDDKRSQKPKLDENVAQALESSRQKYLMALIFINKGDTTKAAQYFEEAIDKLNTIMSYPEIEKNDEFTDLAQSIIEDYESFVKSVDELDENSSFIIVREKLLQEIETIAPAKAAAPIVTGGSTNKRDSAMLATFFSPPDSIRIPLTDNPFVQKNLAFLTTKGGKMFKKWLERGTRYFPMMLRIAEALEMPREIMYLAIWESAMDPNAVSRAGAVGLWQFMRETGQLYDLNKTTSYWTDERRDPEKATRAAMRHLKDLYNEFGDWHLALAAYNCGARAVDRAIKKSKKEKPDFWDIREFLPNETKHYVPIYIAVAKIAMNPAAYGIKPEEIQILPEYQYDVYMLNECVNVKALAKAAGISVDSLRYLNPELLKVATPPDRKSYYLKIPYGSYSNFARNFALLSETEKEPFIVHPVQKGETLASLAKKFEAPESVIVGMNGLNGEDSRLKIGSEIRLPVDADEYDAKNLAWAKKNKKAAPSLADNGGSDAPKMPAQKGKQAEVTHKVKRGETLSSIARDYGARITDLRNYNNLSYGSERLKAGQTIVIAPGGQQGATDVAVNETRPVVSGKKAPVKLAPKVITHKVKRGESIAEIADKYDVSVKSIKAENRLRNSKLKAGKSLRIRVMAPEENLAQAKPSKAALKQEKALPAKQAKNVEPTLAATSRPKAPAMIYHRVEQGETLKQIAIKYSASEDDIRRNNGIKKNRLKVGELLKVPVADSHNNFAKADADENASNESRIEGERYAVHTVQRGESLYSIAQKYGVTDDQIAEWNPDNVRGGASVKAGAKLKIYGVQLAENFNPRKVQEKARPKDDEPKYYSIRSGDTLSSIARRFRTTVSDLKKKNRNIEDEGLQIGQKIRVD